MGATFLGHVDDLARSSAAALPWVAVVALLLFVGVLFVENSYVKHGKITRRQLLGPAGVLAVVALSALVAPAPGAAQSDGPPVGLPDLIADPSFIWFVKYVELPTGLARVMAYDGYIHNIGTGRLDLKGNPQIENGVKQRVFNGTDWEEVGSPTVKFETDDGHNHFHLKEAVHYELWDEGRTAEVGDSSKVGFCLIDTEDMENLYEAFYTIEDSNYCGVDTPELTDLTMGISPGWRDTYDANVTLQWVDVSSVRPGRYWVTAETDPKNEIVESNEDNNGIVFSMNKFAVPGYVARELPLQVSDEPITLKAVVYGTVGARAFVVVEGPSNGRLDVPTGVDLLGDQVRYTPVAGFEGIDSFSYYAHDTSSPFPTSPTIVTVDIEVGDSAGESATETVVAAAEPEIASVPDQVISMYDKTELTMQTEESGAGDLRWFASDLPPGLTIDEGSGRISGVATIKGTMDSTVLVVVGDQQSTVEIGWQVDDPGLPTLHETFDFSTTSTDQLRMHLGTGRPDASYEVRGVPAGGKVSPNLPLLAGVPEEIGDFDVVLTEIVDGEVVAEVTFTWTVRPSVHPSFPI